MAVFPTKQSFPSLESNRIAVSKQGQVAVIKERCIELYGRDVTNGIPWMVRKISASLSRPSDLCFAPNDALVVSDVGDNTIKIFDLTRNLQPVNQIIIGHDFFGMFIVLDRSNVPHFDMRALRTVLKVKDCAQDLINFYNDYCLPHGIKLTINLCQLYKIGMPPSSGGRSLTADIMNARLGVKMMLSYGIELVAMRKDSWKLLAELANVNLPSYQDSNRQKLDQYINLVLSEIKRVPIQFYY